MKGTYVLPFTYKVIHKRHMSKILLTYAFYRAII